VETFNYLLGLRVKKTFATKSFTADFERKEDPELPNDQHTKLTIKGNIKIDAEGSWKFRLVEGWCPKNRFTPNDGAKEKVLVVWRNLTGDIEKDNAVLDAFLRRSDINALDGEFDVIYVNGSNNVPNLCKEGDVWKVQSIEETFFARMWEGV
jgi:adenine-specific DNA-methyltransferase